MSFPSETLTLISVGYNSWDYFRFLAFTAQKLAASGWKEWLIIDNSPNESQSHLLETLPKARLLPRALTYPCLRQAPTFESGHSQDYACSVNQLYKNVTTDYTLLVDPDVALLSPSWDTQLLDLMETGNYDAVGGPYHPYKWQKYSGYPSVIFLLIKTELLQANKFDFCSYSRNPISRWFENLRHKHQGIINRAAPEIIRGSSQDTGWRLPNLFASTNSRTFAFGVPFIRNIDYYFPGKLRAIRPNVVFERPSAGLFEPEDISGNEYDEFWYDDRLFATHHGGASQTIASGKPGWGSERTQLWFSKIMEYTGLDRNEFNRFPHTQSPQGPGSEYSD